MKISYKFNHEIHICCNRKKYHCTLRQTLKFLNGFLYFVSHVLFF
jgi:hypothetical protein